MAWHDVGMSEDSNSVVNCIARKKIHACLLGKTENHEQQNTSIMKVLCFIIFYKIRMLSLTAPTIASYIRTV